MTGLLPLYKFFESNYFSACFFTKRIYQILILPPVFKNQPLSFSEHT